MITSRLTPHHTGNQAASKKTKLGAIAMTYDTKIVPKLLETLGVEDRERLQPGIDAAKNAMGQAQEQLAIQKRLNELGFKDTDLTET
ncbi:MAG: hypothetical protein ACYDCW_15620 [Acidithiobacillus ferrivorans]